MSKTNGQSPRARSRARSRPTATPPDRLPDGERSPPQTLAKAPTGVQGLDEITFGGLPRGRTTLISGGAGCGKTLLASEFLVRGAINHGENGVFLSFEESVEEITTNVRSLGFDLAALRKEGRLCVDFVRIERHEIEETGDFDLEGLFVRMAHAIDSVGAKRIVLDTIEVLFAGFTNAGILRAELRRLFRWLKDRGITAVVTAERADGKLSGHGIEEFVSDCVIVLDHRVLDQVSTRRIRVVKYRGSLHGTNEYPFLIDEDGISVVPITSLKLTHPAARTRVSSGVGLVDEMLAGGFHRGSTVLVSGTAGTGKTSFAAHFVDAACRRGEKCLYFAFEESPDQIVRNMRSIGLDLQPHVDQGLLRFHAARASAHGLEMHLAMLHKLTRTFRPDAVVFDPFDSLRQVGTDKEAAAMLTRLTDFFKSKGTTAMLTSLTRSGGGAEPAGGDISSLVDTWLALREEENGAERTRSLTIVKSRGMPHSNRVQGFQFTSRGVEAIGEIPAGDRLHAPRPRTSSGGR